MSQTTAWVRIRDVNPCVILRHSPSITCPISQVAASIGDWFPLADAAVRDAIGALQRTLCIGGYTDGLAALLNITVEPADREIRTTADGLVP